jgi:hypothetical protein
MLMASLSIVLSISQLLVLQADQGTGHAELCQQC